MLRPLHRFWTRSITRQLMLGIALVHAVLMTIFVFDLVSRERAFLHAQSNEQAFSMAQVLATNATSWVLASDYVGIEELITSQHSFSGLQYALLVDPEGQVLGYTDRTQVGRYLRDPVSLQLLDAPLQRQRLFESEQQLDVAVPILLEGTHLGWARVGFDHSAISDNLGLVTQQGLLYTLVAISVGLLFAWLMALGLSQGLRQLVEQAHRAREGQDPQPVELQRHDELGELAEAFSHMLSELRQREKALADNHALLRSILDATPDLIFFKDSQGHYQGCNDAFTRFVGIERETLIGQDDYDLFPQPIADNFRLHDRMMLQSGIARRNEEWVTYPDGHEVLLETIKLPYYGPHDESLGVLGVSRDITERKRAEERIRQSQSQLEQAQRIAHIGSWSLDLESNEVVWSDEAYRIFELHDHPSLTYEEFLDLVHPEDRLRVDRAYRDSLIQRTPYHIEHRILLPGGRVKYLEEQCESEFDGHGHARHSFGTVQDVTERYLAQRLLEEKQRHLDYLAHYDSLTGLSNRLLFRDRLARALRSAERTGQRVAVLFVDLDQFKQINDSLGHEVGDRVLREVAQRLTVAVRAEDSVSRLGGDEFIIIVNELDEPRYAAQMAQRVLQSLQTPLLHQGQELYLTTSIGISLYPEDGAEVDTLLRNADAAMFRAKAEGRDRFRFYTQELTDLARERIEMESRIRQGLRNGEFTLHYQPQLTLHDERLNGVEALVRWRHPELGMIPPGRFIPLAEESGLIEPLGAWILREACTQMVRWHAQGFHPGRMAVNLSGRQLQQSDLLDTVTQTLSETGCRPEWLELEITESFVMNSPAHSIPIMQSLRSQGIELAIDDFGTGHSSLAYLKQLPISRLKVDQSFVRDVPSDQNDMAIIQAVIALGHSLQLHVLAEGVETPAQRDFLRQAGCDEVQGYLYAHPLSAEALLAQWG